MNHHHQLTRRRWRAGFSVLAATLAVLTMLGARGAGTAGADANDVVLTDLQNSTVVDAWTTVNDPVMGGRSTSTVAYGDGGLVFSGTLSLENNGGFASARGPVDPAIGGRAAEATSLGVRARGDGKTYLLKVDTGQPWSYIQRFATNAGVWQTYSMPVGDFEAVGMRLDPAPWAPQTLDPSSINRVSLYILDKQEGPFQIAVSAIVASI